MAICNWCSEDLGGAPRKVWYDDNGAKYCSPYCLRMAKDGQSESEDEYDTGMGTSVDMWQMVSELLDGEKLPESINTALYALCEGEAVVVQKKK